MNCEYCNDGKLVAQLRADLAAAREEVKKWRGHVHDAEVQMMLARKERDRLITGRNGVEKERDEVRREVECWKEVGQHIIDELEPTKPRATQLLVRVCFDAHRGVRGEVRRWREAVRAFWNVVDDNDASRGNFSCTPEMAAKEKTCWGALYDGDLPALEKAVGINPQLAKEMEADKHLAALVKEGYEAADRGEVESFEDVMKKHGIKEGGK